MSKFKVKCVGHKAGERKFTIGKTYEWENDAITNDNGYTYRSAVNGTNIEKWGLSSFYAFKKVESSCKILITTDGTITIARLYEGKKVVRTAQAKCAPSDTFDFNFGANLAYDRLMGRAKVEPKPAEKPQDKPAEPKQEVVKLYCVRDCQVDRCVVKGRIYEQDERGFIRGEHGLCTAESRIRDGHLVPLVKRPAKVGEYILVTNSDGKPTNPYKNGDVLKVVDDCFSIGVGIKEYHIIYHSEYLVLDGYKG